MDTICDAIEKYAIKKQGENNDLVVAVLSQLITSAAKFTLTKTVDTSVFLFEKYCTVTMEINGRFDCGSNVKRWLLKFIYIQCKNQIQHTSMPADVYFDDDNESEGEEGFQLVQNEVEPLPTNGSLYFWYQGVYVRVSRGISPTAKADNTSLELFKMTAFGTRNKKIFIDMIKEARMMFKQKPEKQVDYYRGSAEHGDWDHVRRIRKARPLASVILAEGVVEAIHEDIIDFYRNEDWYAARGIPYRRGYLLYGPPGCGKTSFIKAISGEIGFDICVLQISDKKLTDEKLNQLLSKIGERSILLLEDIDAAFGNGGIAGAPNKDDSGDDSDYNKKRKKKADKRNSRAGVTFSGLLNAIDGVSSSENYILFMTTNHIEKLDPALIRPGRIDIKQLIDYPNQEQVERLFRQFYPKAEPEMATQFGKAVVALKTKPSMAKVQGLFLNNKSGPEKALLNVDSLETAL